MANYVTPICPICTSAVALQDAAVVAYPGAQLPGRPRSIYFCNVCTVGIAHPQLTNEQLERLYSRGDYWKNADARILRPKDFPGHYVLAVARRNFIAPFLEEQKMRTVSLLDVGAGHGFLGMVMAASAKMRLDRYTAVETDPAMRESLRMTWVRQFPATALEVYGSMAEVRQQYDFVALSHIIEHLKDPKEFLAEIIPKMKDRGLLFIEVPHQDHTFKKDVFPHLLFFTILSMRRLLEVCGFRIRRIACYGRNQDQSLLSLKNEHGALATIAKIFDVSRKVIPRTLSQRFSSWLFGADKENPYGTWIRVVAQKS